MKTVTKAADIVGLTVRMIQEYEKYQLSQEYCLLLTIRDPNGKAPVYDEVAQQLDYKNFLHHNIQLRNVVTIDGTL